MFFYLKDGKEKTNFVPPYFIKSNWETDQNFATLDKFCWSVRDRIAESVNTKSKAKSASNLSNAEKLALKRLIQTKNDKIIINNTDKNVGPSISDKNDVVTECKRQLSDDLVYKKLKPQEFEMVISEIKKSLCSVVQKHMQTKICSKKRG